MERKILKVGSVDTLYDARRNISNRVLMQLHLEDLRHYYNFGQYFMDNIPHVDEYDLQYHKKASRVCNFKGAASPYIMFINPIPERNFRFMRKDSIGINDALSDNQDVIRFDYSDNTFKKQYVNENGAISEEFRITGPYVGKITAKIYDYDDYIQTIQSIEDEPYGFTVNSSQAFVSGPMEQRQIKPKYTVEAIDTKSEGNVVILRDGDNNELERVCRIGGFTLYWDYYSYMISRGFFNDRDVKTSDKKYIKVG